MNDSFVFFMLAGIFLGVNSCADDKECEIPNTICKDNACACSDGYLWNSDNSTCLPYVTEYYGTCKENSQCEWLGENSECKNVCKCLEGFRWYQGECRKYVSLGETCTDTMDCYDGYNLLALNCSSNICVCSDGYYLRDGIDCRKIATGVSEICAVDIDCRFPDSHCLLGKCENSPKKELDMYQAKIEHQMTDSLETNTLPTCGNYLDCLLALPNSECNAKTSTCTCKRGYFLASNGTECLPELGVNSSCKSDKDCKIKPGQCIEGTCYCRDYYMTEDGNRNCIKGITQKNWNCLSGEWCLTLGKYSYCNLNNTCTCAKGSVFNETNFVCELTGPQDPDSCSTDSECQTKILYSSCIDGACGCDSSTRLDNGTCLPNLGSKCDMEDKICTVENSYCDNFEEICLCKDNFISDNINCYENTNAQLGDECQVDIQCSTAMNFTRCQDSKCSCIDEYAEADEACYLYKTYNSFCTTRTDCVHFMGENIACRNSKCQCSTGFHYINNECTSSGSFIRSSFYLILLLVMNLIFG